MNLIVLLLCGAALGSCLYWLIHCDDWSVKEFYFYRKFKPILIGVCTVGFLEIEPYNPVKNRSVLLNDLSWERDTEGDVKIHVGFTTKFTEKLIIINKERSK